MFNGAAIKSDSNRRRATRWAYLMLAMIGLSLSCSVAHEEKLMEIRRLHGAGALGQVTTALNELLASEKVAESCRRWKEKLAEGDPVRETCELIEAVGGR